MADTLWGMPIVTVPSSAPAPTIVIGDGRVRVALDVVPCDCPDAPHVFHVKAPADG
jgi:hypothetical protein